MNMASRACTLHYGIRLRNVLLSLKARSSTVRAGDLEPCIVLIAFIEAVQTVEVQAFLAKDDVFLGRLTLSSSEKQGLVPYLVQVKHRELLNLNMEAISKMHRTELTDRITEKLVSGIRGLPDYSLQLYLLLRLLQNPNSAMNIV